VDTGSEQLVVPLVSPAAVARCRPDAALLERHCRDGQRAMAYVWARDGEGRVLARFFFPKQGALCEDPGTGSACANLGGYVLATGSPGPLRWRIEQGDRIGRPCVLDLEIADGSIGVGGRVIEIGRGEIAL
jgi:PhzF family phenazine biosynthesis protein